MDFHGDHVSGVSGSGGTFEGDFDSQDDNYTRSANLSAVQESCQGIFFDEVSAERNAGKRFTGVRAVSQAGHLWFEDGMLAPPLPTDPLFRLGPTTVFISDGCASADGIGNSLCAYFDAEAAATITKVSSNKFAIKAEIECQGFRCELKVRVYRQPLGHVVEFQRRDGDAFVFAMFYERAKAQLGCVGAPRGVPVSREEIAETEMVILPPL